MVDPTNPPSSDEAGANIEPQKGTPQRVVDPKDPLRQPDVTVLAKTVTVPLPKDALNKVFDTDVIAGAMATSLSSQIQIEFNKEGGLIKKLAGGGIGAMKEILKGLGQAQETYFLNLINNSQAFSRRMGGVVTQRQTLEQVEAARQSLGGSLARLGVTPDNIIEGLEKADQGANKLIAFLQNKEGKGAFVGLSEALRELGVAADLTQFQELTTDLQKLDKEGGQKLVKRFKEITAVSLGVSKALNISLGESFRRVFGEANKLVEKGQFNFDDLKKSVQDNIGTFAKFGVEVPGVLNKALPSFQEIFGISRNLSIALKGFTIDPKEFINQTGSQRLESIFQSLRRAQQAGTFAVEEQGLGRNQQIAFLSQALSGTGLGQADIARLLVQLDKGTKTLAGVDFDIGTGDQALEEVKKRARRTMSREQATALPTQVPAEQAAFSPQGMKQISSVMEDMINNIDSLTEERKDSLKAFGMGMLDVTEQFAKIAAVAKSFQGGGAGAADFKGILAYSVFGPPGTFDKTINSIKDLGTTTDNLMKVLSGEGSAVAANLQSIENNPTIVKFNNAFDTFKQQQQELTTGLQKKYDELEGRYNKLIRAIGKRFPQLNIEGILDTSASGGGDDAGRVAKIFANELGRVLDERGVKNILGTG